MRKLPVLAAFGHVWRSTLSNLGFAWHVSWPWMVAILPVNIVGNVYAISTAPAPGQASEAYVAVSLIIGLLTMFAFSSIAVSWHRYILKDEVPQGWNRLRADNTVWRYFGNTILIIAMLIGGLVPIVIVALGALALMGDTGLIFAIPAYLAGLVFGISAFYRMSVKLPAIALERQDYLIRHAWAYTQGNHWQLVGLALLFTAVVLALALMLLLVGFALGATGNTFALFVLITVQLLLNWLATVMAVTLLTSLYGYFVEKRDF